MQLACGMPGCTAFQACWSHDNSVSVPNDHLPPADQLDKLKDVAPPDFGSLRVSGPTVDACACSYSVCFSQLQHLHVVPVLLQGVLCKGVSPF
jgi:hypothetical protein